MRTPSLSTHELYHVYNRGVNKRDLFQSEQDYWRFLNLLRILNTSENRNNSLEKSKLRQQFLPTPGNQLVNILAFCLMPNHLHFLLEQCVDDGISKFMHKICMSHAKYFNITNKRTGALFEPKFKSKHVKTESYYSQISKYIHRNPLDLCQNRDEIAKRTFLLDYKWSSLHAYLNTQSNDFVDKRIMDEFRDPNEYLKFIFS